MNGNSSKVRRPGQLIKSAPRFDVAFEGYETGAVDEYVKELRLVLRKALSQLSQSRERVGELETMLHTASADNFDDDPDTVTAAMREATIKGYARNWDLFDEAHDAEAFDRFFNANSVDTRTRRFLAAS